MKDENQKSHIIQSEGRQTTRRKIILGTAVLSSAPLASVWSKPIISAVILPAHAATSVEEPLPEPEPTPTPPTPAALELFSLSVSSPNGPSSQGAEFFASADDGTFTIEIYTDGQLTDLSPQILRVTITSIGEFVLGQRVFCNNDGSEGDALAATSRIQVVAYTAGVSIELQFEFSPASFTLPLDNAAMSPSCPVL